MCGHSYARLTPRLSCGVRTPALSAGRERAARRHLKPVVRRHLVHTELLPAKNHKITSRMPVMRSGNLTRGAANPHRIDPTAAAKKPYRIACVYTTSHDDRCRPERNARPSGKRRSTMALAANVAKQVMVMDLRM